MHEQIELAESQLDIAAATLRRIRLAVAAGELPVRDGGVWLSADEASLALDGLAALASPHTGDARVAELQRLRARLSASLYP